MTPPRTPGPRRRLGALFEKALALSTEERGAFVDSVCREDPALGDELASLVASWFAAPDYLEGLAGDVLPAALRALPARAAPRGRMVGRYEVLETIGRGGMGVVCRARDPALDRLVALKFLSPHRTADSLARARLMAEARAASALDHPNIATIYEIGATEPGPDDPGGSRLFIAMAYYPGTTLEGKLARGPIPIPQALDWGIQVASGLSRAHEAGIVHRDIKPANLLVTDRGQVKILDFGVAKVAGLELTGEGARLGTVGYMSPEQTAGGVVDPRTDVWSLGVVLYEMLTGMRPFRGEVEEAVVYGIRRDEPPSLDSLRPEVPPDLGRVVYRCLAKEPAARYATAEVLLAELQAVDRGTTGRPSPVPAERQGIVVLPIVNISPDPDNEYFSDGLTEEVIAHLAHIRALRVISRTSSMRLKGTDKDLPTIGRELGVRYALEGSVRKSGDDLRISIQLLDAATDEHLWVEAYEGTVAEVLQIQERVAGAIARALRIELTPAEERALGQRDIEDPVALESYLRARHEMWSFSGDGLRRARRHILNALELVGDNELLLATLGQIHVWFLQAGVAPEPEHLDRASECADAIFRLTPDSGHGHRLRGFVEFQRGNLRGASPPLQISLERNPDHPDALATLGYVYCLAGREQQALPLFERLLVVDPLTPLNHAMPGFAAAMEGRFADAVEPYRTFLRMDDDGAFSRMNWVWILGLNGRIEETRGVVAAMEEEHAGTPFTSTARSLFHGFRGERGAALEAISPVLREAARHTEMFSRFLAECSAMAGDVDGALDSLEQAVELGLANHPYLARVAPTLQEVRGERRFHEILARVEEKWRAFERAPGPHRLHGPELAAPHSCEAVEYDPATNRAKGR